jgi:CheY-like chemotaxis protein
LAGLVEDVCATFTAQTARKAIGLEFHVDAGTPQLILGDPVRLRQVLTNLIGNAIKFTEKGGVKVEARWTTNGQLELAVEDTGIGIDPRFTKSLFQPFKQADVATTRRYGGTGLGLSIVKQLVELMHGSVRCESTPGVGSRFTVTLPLKPWIPSVGSLPGRSAAPHAAGAAKARPDPTPGDLGYKVLLAEDHPINREVITRQLVKLGCACDCAQDGEEAWEMLMAPGANYALLLTDCHMPRLDGYALTARLREREAAWALPRLPIVALTANALEGEAERCLALGMDAYLSKPLQLGDLRDALVTVVTPKPLKDAMDAAPYASLTELCSGDLGKVVELIDVFVAATEEDMKAMDRAAEADDYVMLQKLAHRLSSACHQLDEDDAVTAFKNVEHLRADDEAEPKRATREAYREARDELESVLARAAEFTRLHR